MYLQLTHMRILNIVAMLKQLEAEKNTKIYL